MAWVLKFEDEHGCVNGSMKLLEDDVTFYAILKKRRVENVPDDSKKYCTRVRCTHLANYVHPPTSEFIIAMNQKNPQSLQKIVFYMTLLEASKIERSYPTFARDGLMGRWKFCSSNSKTVTDESEPFVVLLEPFHDEKVSGFLHHARSKKNPDFLRHSYE